MKHLSRFFAIKLFLISVLVSAVFGQTPVVVDTSAGQPGQSIVFCGDGTVKFAIGACPVAPASTPPSVSQANYIGCYTDSPARALPNLLTLFGVTTIESCIQAAKTGGFTYAGLQYGGECWAGNNIGQVLTPNSCTMPCSGNKLEICGDIWHNSIYLAVPVPPVSPPTPPTPTPVIVPVALHPEVCVIVQDNTGPEPGTGSKNASQWVADYYMAARGITCAIHIQTYIEAGDTTANIGTGRSCLPGGMTWVHDPLPIGDVAGCLIRHTSSTNISAADYQTLISASVKAALKNYPAGQIKFLVPVYGVPINLITGYGTDSVDSRLAQELISAPQPYPGTIPYTLWVTRLDGADPVVAAALVDKAIYSETHVVNGTGYFDLRGLQAGDPYYSGDTQVLGAYNQCVAVFAKARCVLNDQSVTHAMITSAPDALWAYGWYDLGAGNAAGYHFSPGAVGTQLTSNAGNCIRSPCIGGYVAAWLTAGITATGGPVSEPGLGGFTPFDQLFRNLWSGLTFGESAYKQGFGYASYPQMVFVGDPLYRPKLK